MVTTGADATAATWHVLDNVRDHPVATLVCVHGNPTWSYLWRDLLAAAPDNIRVVAVDQLDMGYSERTGTVRRLADRIDDLDRLIAALDVGGRVVTVGHDWGGPVSLGWAQRHPDRLAGVVLVNTAVHQPRPTFGASFLRTVSRTALRELMCVRTPAFVRGALALSKPRPAPEIAAAYAAPYDAPDRRHAIGDFVADIPFDAEHPTAATLDGIAAGLAALADVPAMVLWGGKDPVFSDVFLADLLERLPHAAVHRFPRAGHLSPEDADIAPVLFDWIAGDDVTGDSTKGGQTTGGQMTGDSPSLASSKSRERLWSALDTMSEEERPAIVEIEPGATTTATFAELSSGIADAAAGMYAHGVRFGDRVALLVPPGINLSVALHAVWRVGAVAVFVDAGLGASGIGDALASADPKFLIGNEKALAAARAMRWPGERIGVGPVNAGLERLLGTTNTLEEMVSAGRLRTEVDRPSADAIAAIAFTSGATGPAKGVVYRHHQLEAQRDALVRLYGIRPDDRLVAAFAPFALFGPIMGIASVVPDMEITAPATLTAEALADAAVAIDATMIFASPAAIYNVVRTARGLTTGQWSALERVRLFMSAGAPLPRQLLRRAAEIMPNAEIHTPYGMTEVLPVADISLVGIEDAGDGPGVCVGFPVPEAEVAIAALDHLARPAEGLTSEPGVVGEVCIRAPHMRDGYDRLWATDAHASQPPGWHRSGDVGRLDGSGRLWIEGRLAHVIVTATGPVTPIAVEHCVNDVEGVARSAVVGVGPVGTQVVVVVIEPEAPERSRTGLAGLSLSDRVREAAGLDVAAVLTVRKLPVDVRHNSKIDRLALASWAERVCAGERVGSP